MSPTVEILLTLLVGVAGGGLAVAVRFPGGALFGSLIAVAALHIALPTFEPLGAGFRTAAQIAIGGVIGASLTRSPLKAVRELGWPLVLVLVLLLGSASAMALLMARFTSLPLVTSLFSFAPGGASDLAAAALQLEADVVLIASIHVVRQLAVFVILAAAFARFFKPRGDGPAVGDDPGPKSPRDG